VRDNYFFNARGRETQFCFSTLGVVRGNWRRGLGERGRGGGGKAMNERGPGGRRVSASVYDNTEGVFLSASSRGGRGVGLRGRGRGGG